MTTAKRVLVFDGIGEDGPHTMAGGLARLLHLPVVHVPYDRSYGPVGGGGQAYAATRAQGLAAGNRLLADGIPSILIGFSAGAHIAGDLAFAGHAAIVGAILIADPAQPAHITNNGLSGVSGPRALVSATAPSVPIRWVWNVRDMICQCPADSPWRDFADFTELLSLRPRDQRAFALDTIADFKERIRRPFSLFSLWGAGRRFSRAIDDGLGYLAPPLGRGEHVKYGANWLSLSDWARAL